jgi:hypothetical protein
MAASHRAARIEVTASATMGPLRLPNKVRNCATVVAVDAVGAGDIYATPVERRASHVKPDLAIRAGLAYGDARIAAECGGRIKKQLARRGAMVLPVTS